MQLNGDQRRFQIAGLAEGLTAAAQVWKREPGACWTRLAEKGKKHSGFRTF
jgi:hypothetical protein